MTQVGGMSGAAPSASGAQRLLPVLLEADVVEQGEASFSSGTCAWKGDRDVAGLPGLEDVGGARYARQVEKLEEPVE